MTCPSPTRPGCWAGAAARPNPCCSAPERASAEPMARRVEMTDEQMDALIRRLDVTFDPDAAFVQSTYASLRPRAHAARVGDASRIGRIAREVRLAVAGAR